MRSHPINGGVDQRRSKEDVHIPRPRRERGEERRVVEHVQDQHGDRELDGQERKHHACFVAQKIRS